MRKNMVLPGVLTSLLLLAPGASSWAATVRVTDAALEPATITVNRGEEVVWLDFTLGRTAQLNLRYGERAGAHSTVDKDGVARATFELPGTYEYTAYAGAGGLQPHALNGRIVVR